MSTLPIHAPSLAGRCVDFGRACFSSLPNTLISVVVLALGGWLLAGALRWGVLDASWTGTEAADCRPGGACWVFIRARTNLILYGNYTAAERWRVDLAALVGIVGVLALLWSKPGFRAVAAATLSYGLVSGILLRGGIAGLEPVPTSQWGGLMLTIVVAAWTIVTAVPLGLLLALGRRSKLRMISWLIGAFIDIVRALPLLGLLFLVIVMFPLFTPPGWEIDRLLRALLAFSIFNAGNLAEVFRGGLQSVARGQEEAAATLGLSRLQSTWYVVVPQAVALSVPAMINVCIAILKETTIIQIVSLYDFLGVLNAGLSDPAWLKATEARSTVYAFAAIVFFLACYALSLASRKLERTY